MHVSAASLTFNGLDIKGLDMTFIFRRQIQ